VSSAKKPPIVTVIPTPTQPDYKPFVVMNRTDGLSIIYDDRQPLGKRTVWTSKRGDKLADAIAVAKKMYEAMKAEKKG
jgi:hypothetical protein